MVPLKYFLLIIPRHMEGMVAMFCGVPILLQNVPHSVTE